MTWRDWRWRAASTILARSLIGVIALPVLLLAQIPGLARRRAS